MPTLMEVLNGKLNLDKKQRPFVRHYLRQHGFVPLWVLSNDLTFGNMVHFYQLMQRGDQQRTCTIIANATDRHYQENKKTLSPRNLLRSAGILVDFRNLCAHDERLYCAKFGNEDYSSMVNALSDLLGIDGSGELAEDFMLLIKKYHGRLHCVSGISLLGEMGFRIPVGNRES